MLEYKLGKIAAAVLSVNGRVKLGVAIMFLIQEVKLALKPKRDHRQRTRYR